MKKINPYKLLNLINSVTFFILFQNMPYIFSNSMVIDEVLPLTMGGGIGQSRLSMLLLEKLHIGEVQSSIWDEYTLDICSKSGIPLL